MNGTFYVSTHTSSITTETFISLKISFFRPKLVCPENLKTLEKCVNSSNSTNSPFVDMSRLPHVQSSGTYLQPMLHLPGILFS